MGKRTKQDTTKRKPVYTASGIALGAGLGLVASLLFFDNLALSLIFGAAVGLVIGALIDWQTSQKGESQ
jgi:predicted lysophospholipase L1 biosynthesis ABC-type transport system permease subunit